MEAKSARGDDVIKREKIATTLKSLQAMKDAYARFATLYGDVLQELAVQPQDSMKTVVCSFCQRAVGLCHAVVDGCDGMARAINGLSERKISEFNEARVIFHTALVNLDTGYSECVKSALGVLKDECPDAEQKAKIEVLIGCFTQGASALFAFQSLLCGTFMRFLSAEKVREVVVLIRLFRSVESCFVENIIALKRVFEAA